MPDVVVACMAGRTFVKRHGNGGTQIGLNLHALLRPHEYLVAVDMGIKVNSFFLNLAQSCQGKYLEPAGIREDRAVPVHKPVQSAKFPYELVAGAHMEMIGIGQARLARPSFVMT